MKKKQLQQEKMINHIHQALVIATNLEDILYEEENYKELSEEENAKNVELEFALEDIKALLHIAINLYVKRRYL